MPNHPDLNEQIFTEMLAIQEVDGGEITKESVIGYAQQHPDSAISWWMDLNRNGFGLIQQIGD